MNNKGLRLKETLAAMSAYSGIDSIVYNRNHEIINVNNDLILQARDAYEVFKKADNLYNAFADIDYTTALKYALVYLFGSDFLSYE